jgi:hypothetical protein
VEAIDSATASADPAASGEPAIGAESSTTGPAVVSARDEAALAELMADVPSDGPSFQIYGFADLNISRPFVDKSSSVAKIANFSSFAIGNVNVYLASNLTHGFSSLVEVRFTYMPSGNYDPTGKITTTYATDAASYGRSDRWGGIILQRVHLDYGYGGFFNVRVGQFLTPYGIWNVDHGSPTVIPIFKPYPIGNAYLPERQVGVELYGTYLIKNTTLGYHLTLSNGRGDIETTDFDKNKALGGRLFVANDSVGSLKVGVSAYGGRATQAVNISATPSAQGLDIKLSSANQFDEFAVAADLLWEWKNLRIQGEGIVTQVRYTKEGRRVRTSMLGAPVGLVADHVAYAWYGLIGYRLPWLSIMPFFLVDQANQARGAGPDSFFQPGTLVTGYNFGLNVRPIASVVLKTQVTLVRTTTGVNTNTTLVGGQAAWAF